MLKGRKGYLEHSMSNSIRFCDVMSFVEAVMFIKTLYESFRFVELEGQSQ